MSSKGWRIIHIGAVVLWMTSLISCRTAIQNASTVSPTASETMAILSATPYAPTEPLIKVPPFPYPHPEIIPSPVVAYPFPEIVPPPAVAYPYPGIIPSPVVASPYPEITPSLVPSSTPTVYKASIQTLSPPEWGTIAAQLSTTPSDAATPPPITPTPQSTPTMLLVPKHNLRITFVDRLHGWIAGSADWEDGSADAIASTSDGGKTWQAIPVPPIDENDLFPMRFYEDFSRSRLLFIDVKNGWIYQKSLFRTNDGGRTWKQEHLHGTIIQMGKATDGTFWALEQAGDDRTLWRVSGDSYASWIKLGYQFPFAMNQVYLAIIDDQHAWMTYWINFQTGDPNAGSHLYRTSDGGKNWERVIPPKTCNYYPLIVSPVDIQELWMGCGFAAGAGSGISAVYESSDGGTSWSERKSDTLGYFMDLTAVSKLFVYMTYAQIITFTYDGGKTWNDAKISCPLNSQTAYFIDQSYGWAACDSSINLTVNGGRTWELIHLPGQ